ncbi:hypothetical protein GN278_11075 [Rhodobacteraceae bacterium Araon29]
MPARTLKSPVTYSVLIIAACAVLMSCAKEVPSQVRFGLGASRVKTDQCRISDAVERYFAAGEVGNIPRRKPTTLKEMFWTAANAYGPGEVGYHEYRYQNAYIHLLHYVVSQDDFRYQPNCSTRMEIEITSWVPSSRRPRVNATEVYDFRANSNNQLCLHNDTYKFKTVIEQVLVRACVHVENLQDDFNVDIKFAPDHKK